MNAPRTNTARAMLEELKHVLLAAYKAPDLDAAREQLEDATVFFEPLSANLDSLWDDVTSLQNENLRLAADVHHFTVSMAKDLAYIEQLERANSALHVKFAEEQQEREALTAAIGHTLGEHAAFFEKANALRGKGTPRATIKNPTQDDTARVVAHIGG